jgi:HSP20 family protein
MAPKILGVTTMDERGKSSQQNREQESQTQNPTRMQRNQESTSGESQGLQRSQNRGLERRSQLAGNYPSIFSVSPGEFFTMSPITLMRRFTEDIDRAFGLAENRGSAGLLGQERDWVPRIEVQQSGNNLVVHAELPGLNEKDVRLEATDEGLLIQGERQRQQESDEEGWRHSEFSYGRFSRLIPLPENAKIDQARANFRDGVLEVTVPVPEAENKRRQIPIGSTGQTKEQAAGGGGASRAASVGR